MNSQDDQKSLSLSVISQFHSIEMKWMNSFVFSYVCKNEVKENELLVYSNVISI